MHLLFLSSVITSLLFVVAYAAPRPVLPPRPVAASMRDGLPVQRGGGSAADTEWIDLLTAVELAQTLPMLSELRKIYDKTEIGFKLEQSRHITIFMPSNDALKASKLNLLQMPYEASLRVLQLHIIPELIKASELPEGSYEYETMAGVNVTIDISRSAPKKRANSRQTVSPLHVTVSPVDGNIKAVVLDPYGVDNANGVSYITNTLMVPADIIETYGSGRGAEGEEFELPDYIEATNQFHWQYGRVGGIPEIDASSGERLSDNGRDIELGDSLRGSRQDTDASQGTGDNIVGVLKPSGNQQRLRSAPREMQDGIDVEDAEKGIRRTRRRPRGDL